MPRRPVTSHLPNCALAWQAVKSANRRRTAVLILRPACSTEGCCSIVQPVLILQASLIREPMAAHTHINAWQRNAWTNDFQHEQVQGALHEIRQSCWWLFASATDNSMAKQGCSLQEQQRSPRADLDHFEPRQHPHRAGTSLFLRRHKAECPLSAKQGLSIRLCRQVAPHCP